MEIISGLARGVQLTVPPGETVRPTAARARKALFDSLGDLAGTRVADLCAGAGGLGLEAASRGAAEAVFGGILDIKPIITHHFDVKDFQKGFDAMLSGQSGKVILDWTHINDEGERE